MRADRGDPEGGGPPALATVAGIVLAAGASSRMGRNKLLLELGGESLLRRATRRAVAAGLEPVIVVLGHEADRARVELGGLPVTVVLNPGHARGIGSSLGVGVSTLAAGADPARLPRAAVVLLADMPLVTERMIARLVARYRQAPVPLALSRYDGVRAPPTLYDRTLFPEILEVAAAGGSGREVVERHADQAVTLDFDPAALFDIDRPEDYDRVRGALGAAEETGRAAV